MANALYHTLGCKLNFAETATIAAMLAERGIGRYTEGTPGQPDLVVVNTCSVTGQADHKGRNLIRRLHRTHPDAAIVVTGCFAQLKPEEISSLPGVVLIAGNDRKDLIAKYVEQWLEDRQKRIEVVPITSMRPFTSAGERGDRTRYFLKVQDGCDYWCSYCTIPKARGRSRSPRIARIVEQARKAASDGVREVVLTGVNIGDFGKGTDETFYDLVRALDSPAVGIDRYRISSIEPNLLTPEIIDYVAGSPHFMPHFHIPLQSGSDSVLKLMRRRYDTELFASRIKLIRERIPDAFIGVDLIVGARGETVDEFEKSRNFCNDLDINHLHVFPYSERPGTAALTIKPIVPEDEKRRRAHIMGKISNEHQQRFAKKFIGREMPVLVENEAGLGFTPNYLRVKVPDAAANRIVNVRLGQCDENFIFDATIV